MIRWALLLAGTLASGSACAETIRGPADVIDGDTIRVLEVVVRLAGIDAPETNQECRRADNTPTMCGREATRALSKLIGREDVSCETTGTDPHGRALGLCRAADTDLNASMVRSGMAAAFVRYSDRYVGEEAAAQVANEGLWAGSFEMPWEWRSRQLIDLPEGQCAIKGNIARDGERIYHMPFHEFYARTQIDEERGERWFCTEQDASEAGWRRALR